MTMNLRSDDRFVEDEGWHAARCTVRELPAYPRQGQNILFLELGVGYNTPGIIKYPFWRMTAENPRAVYACVDRGQAECPQAIAERSICIDGDIGETLARMNG